MEILIKQHNKNVLHNRENSNTSLCNCRIKASCPLNGKCVKASIIYKAQVSIERKYVIYTETVDRDFKSRYNNHTMSFRHKSWK